VDRVAEELEGIRRAIEGLNGTAREALEAIPKPESRVERTIRMAVLIAGILGALNAVDIVRRWIAGG